MLINNTAARIVGLPGNILLKPGNNDVKAEQWNVAKENKVVKTWIKQGILEVSGDESGHVDEDLGDLGSHNAKEAIKIVKDTFDKELLEKWKDEETRKTVLEEIDEQLDSL